MRMVLDMEENEIASPRPLFEEKIKPISGKKFERMEIGTKWAGIIVDVTRKGIEMNGYYRLNVGDKLCSTSRDPVFIPWEELEKIKERVNKPVSRKKPKAKEEETYEDFDLDVKYLESLPKVEINGNYYYIDSARRERRSVANPNQVVKY